MPWTCSPAVERLGLQDKSSHASKVDREPEQPQVDYEKAPRGET